jgi:hypothetical protein
LLKIRIVEVDIGAAMSRRRKIDEPGAGLHQRRDPVDQNEMAEVIGPELRLEPVRRLAEWRPRNASVGDDEVERPAVVDQPIGAGAYAHKRRQVELDQLKSAAVRGGRLDGRGRRVGLCKIARRADDLSAVRCEGAGRLHAEARRHTCHQRALSAQAHAVQHLIGRGCGSEGVRHDRLPVGQARIAPASAPPRRLPGARSRDKRRKPPRKYTEVSSA